MIKLDKDIDPNRIVRQLGKRYKLVPYLEKAFATFEDEWQFTYEEKIKDHHWHPSSHCHEPVTKLYAIATDQVMHEPLPGSLRKIFQVGHFWHQLLQYICVREGWATKETVECSGLLAWTDSEVARVGLTKNGLSAVDWTPAPYHAVAGSADVCPLVIPDWSGGVDFKTMNGHLFKQEGFNDFFGLKYECQMNIYMELFDQPEWMIFAINKDSGEFKEYVYERNQPLIDAILDKWKFVSLCLDSGEEPTKEDDKMFVLPELFGPTA